jgi:hypothetical protein
MLLEYRTGEYTRVDCLHAVHRATPQFTTNVSSNRLAVGSISLSANAAFLDMQAGHSTVWPHSSFAKMAGTTLWLPMPEPLPPDHSNGIANSIRGISRSLIQASSDRPSMPEAPTTFEAVEQPIHPHLANPTRVSAAGVGGADRVAGCAANAATTFVSVDDRRTVRRSRGNDRFANPRAAHRVRGHGWAGEPDVRCHEKNTMGTCDGGRHLPSRQRAFTNAEGLGPSLTTAQPAPHRRSGPSAIFMKRRRLGAGQDCATRLGALST